MKARKLPQSALAAVLPAVTVLTALVVGVAFGVELSLLVVAGGALAGVIALLWASVQSLTGESPLTLEEAMTLGAPSAEEEQKRAVLRALKDLEFERGVGKISEEDYAELSARYRAEAKRLMQILDAGSEPERLRAEKALRERIAKTAEAEARAAERAAAEAAEAAHAAETEDASDAEAAGDAETVAAASEPLNVPPGAGEEKAS
jgi:DNA-binding transcriptional ArsR family regulator